MDVHRPALIVDRLPIGFLGAEGVLVELRCLGGAVDLEIGHQPVERLRQLVCVCFLRRAVHVMLLF
ncbi:hypothetical protein D3C71_2126060 [compost metagenome]